MSLYLMHHGIKGQKWGIRRFQNYDGTLIKNTPNNTVELKNYKGKCYFISEKELDGATLEPRVPENYFTKNGYEDTDTKRVCFSSDPGKCLTALSMNVSNKEYYVYEPDDISNYRLFKPNKIAVPDSDITNEMWITEPVTVKKVGKIKCTGDDGKDGMKFKYGNNTAELYGWNYEWLKHNDNNTDILIHHGIKGQKWGVRRYQNPDGTLTEEGKKRNNKIPKGSTVFRAVSNGSTKFMDREYTYVNITEDYADHSINTSSGFDGRFDTDIEMKTKKPLKIASTEDYFWAVMESNKINPKIYLKKVPNDVIEKGKYSVHYLLEHEFKEGEGGNYEIMNNTIKYLKNKGFDGVVDPIDGAHQEKRGEKQIATIVFDPSKNLEIINKYEW